MKPYYQDQSVTIYHGDCRQIVPQLGNFDLLLTDPPYGMRFQSNYRQIKHKAIEGDDQMDVELIESLIKKAKCAAYVFCRWDNLLSMPKPKSVIVWVKNNTSMGDLNHEHARQWEACCFYPMENHKFNRRPSDVIYAKRTDNAWHPTQKPVDVMIQLIDANQCQTILDPFAGSGTTGRAAKDLGKQAVLIEMDEQYCEIAAQRMAQEVLL